MSNPSPKYRGVQVGVLARLARLGTGKTRLAATVGRQRALDIYRFLIKHTAREIEQSGLRATVFLSPARGDEDVWSPPIFTQELQQPSADLGERLYAALNYLLPDDEGPGGAILIGTDCPYLRAEHLRTSAKLLHTHDAVLGPAADGGYYLLACNTARRELFDHIDWSTSHVADQTRSALAGLGWTVAELPVLEDVDTEADWQRYLRTEGVTLPQNLPQ